MDSGDEQAVDFYVDSGVGLGGVIDTISVVGYIY